jgi:hypothetical protein
MRFFAWYFGVATVLAGAAFGGRAAAAETAETTESTKTPAPSTTRWYGWQTLLADASAVGALAIGGITDDRAAADALVASSAVLYLAAAPAVHLGHHRGGIAGVDLAVRVSAPLIGGGIGLAVGALTVPDAPCVPRENSPEELGCAAATPLLISVHLVTAMLWGMVGGAASASAIDSLLLAREKVEKVTVTPAPRLSSAWKPTLRRIDGGAAVGVAGEF